MVNSPGTTVLCVEVHRIDALPFGALEGHFGFVGVEEGLGEGVTPVNGESRACHLNPCVDIGEELRGE